MYSLYPVMIASTIAVVIFIIGVSFGSALLPIRLLLTVAISLCWTYGLMVCLSNAI
jgi:predicted RND superfamily exporter protein